MSLFSNVGQMGSDKVNAMKTGLQSLFGKKQDSIDKETAFDTDKSNQNTTVTISEQARSSAEARAKEEASDIRRFQSQISGFDIAIANLRDNKIPSIENNPTLSDEEKNAQIKQINETIDGYVKKQEELQAKIDELKPKQEADEAEAAKEQSNVDTANSQIQTDDTGIAKEGQTQAEIDPQIEQLETQIQEAEQAEQAEQSEQSAGTSAPEKSADAKQPEKSLEDKLKEANDNFKNNRTLENQSAVYNAMDNLAKDVIANGSPAEKSKMEQRLASMIEGNKTGDKTELLNRLKELNPNHPLVKAEAENDSVAEKSIERPAERPTERPTERPAERPAEKPAEKSAEKKEPTFDDLAAKYQHHKDEAIAASKREGGDSQRVANMEQGYATETKLKEMSATKLADLESQIAKNKDILTNSRRGTDTTKALQDETKALEGMRDAIQEGDYSKYQKIKTEYERANADAERLAAEKEANAPKTVSKQELPEDAKSIGGQGSVRYYEDSQGQQYKVVHTPEEVRADEVPNYDKLIHQGDRGNTYVENGNKYFASNTPLETTSDKVPDGAKPQGGGSEAIGQNADYYNKDGLKFAVPRATTEPAQEPATTPANTTPETIYSKDKLPEGAKNIGGGPDGTYYETKDGQKFILAPQYKDPDYKSATLKQYKETITNNANCKLMLDSIMQLEKFEESDLNDLLERVYDKTKGSQKSITDSQMWFYELTNFRNAIAQKR